MDLWVTQAVHHFIWIFGDRGSLSGECDKDLDAKKKRFDDVMLPASWCLRVAVTSLNEHDGPVAH